MPRKRGDRHSVMRRAELAVISHYYRNNPEKIAEYLGGENVEPDPTPIDAGFDSDVEVDPK